MAESKQPKIFVTRWYPGSGLPKLVERYGAQVNKANHVLTKWQLKRAVRGVDVIVSLLTDHIDAEIMDAAGAQLKLIANYAVGFDNIDLKAAKERNIIVTNTPGAFSQSIAEHTFALILAVARRIVEADQFTVHNKYHQWEPNLLIGQELQGKTIGIIGLGRIGGGVATIAKGFGMKVIFHDEVRNKKLEKALNVAYHNLETVIEESDVISLHVPLLPTTKHLIDEHELAIMKPNAILINTSRGPVVNEQALVHALTKRQIWGAGLDVFEHEPHISKILERLPNVVMTPHIASATNEAREIMSQLVADNVIGVLEKGQPVSPVNPE